MRRVFLCSIQAATVLAALCLDWIMSRETGRKAEPGFALMTGVLFALIFTLIFLMFEQAIGDIRTWLAAKRPSQPTRIDPVFPQSLDDGITDRRITSDSRPRIGK